MTRRSDTIVVAPDPAPVADPAAEIGADLQRTLARYTDWAVRTWRETLDDIEKQAGMWLPARPMTSPRYVGTCGPPSTLLTR